MGDGASRRPARATAAPLATAVTDPADTQLTSTAARPGLVERQHVTNPSVNQAVEVKAEHEEAMVIKVPVRVHRGRGPETVTGEVGSTTEYEAAVPGRDAGASGRTAVVALRGDPGLDLSVRAQGTAVAREVHRR